MSVVWGLSPKEYECKVSDRRTTPHHIFAPSAATVGDAETVSAQSAKPRGVADWTGEPGLNRVFAKGIDLPPLLCGWSIAFARLGH